MLWSEKRYIGCICIRKNSVKGCSRPWNPVIMLLNCQPGLCLVLAQAKCHSRRSLLGKTRSWQRPAAIPSGHFACGHSVLERKRFMIGMWTVPWLLSFVQENDLRHMQSIGRYAANLAYSFQDMLAVWFWAQHLKGICDKALSIEKLNPFTLFHFGTSEISGNHNSPCFVKNVTWLLLHHFWDHFWSHLGACEYMSCVSLIPSPDLALIDIYTKEIKGLFWF